MTTRCPVCREIKPLDQFGANKNGPHGKNWQCRLCTNERSKRRYQEDPLVGFRQVLNKKGILLEQYDQMSEDQGHVCAICHHPETTSNQWGLRRLAVDHDHACCPGVKSCGRCIRGLLCSSCNHLLGNARDCREILDAASKYLSASATTVP